MKSKPFRITDSTGRRKFIKNSSGLFAGLTIPSLLRLRAESAGSIDQDQDTSVILVYMGGGPSQFETYDPKPEAPIEVRGKYGAIRTNVPGTHISELLPKQATIMDKVTLIRSLHHEQASHIAEHIVETGYDLMNSANARKGEMPSVGSIISKMRGSNPVGIPAYVRLRPGAAYSDPHWLGENHRFFGVREDPNESDFAVKNLALSTRLTVERLDDRRGLLEELDQQQRSFESRQQSDSIDEFTNQAFTLVTGNAARNAFDISRESEPMRDRYGRTSIGQRMLLARRLAEAGVPYVTVRNSAPDWDDHLDMDKRIKQRLPEFDQALTALICDLHERGLNRKILVVAMGEFGRTPRINKNGGRDHWPTAGNALISGGNYRMGQVIGATDSKGSAPTASPYRPQNVLTMIYRHLGIDPSITFDDYSGRPRYILDERSPIKELIG